MYAKVVKVSKKKREKKDINILTINWGINQSKNVQMQPNEER